MTEQRGLTCNIYRPAHGGDASNGGLSTRVSYVTLIGPGIPKIFAPHDNAPAVQLRIVGGAVNAAPVDADGTWWMFGGSFIYTSDSRFPSQTPIPLHDRCEASELSEALIRRTRMGKL